MDGEENFKILKLLRSLFTALQEIDDFYLSKILYKQLVFIIQCVRMGVEIF